MRFATLLLLNLTLWPSYLIAQVVGPTKVIPLYTETERSWNYGSPLCSQDRMWDVKDGKWLSISISEGRIIGQHKWVPKEGQGVATWFMAGEYPAAVWYKWDKNTGVVSLSAQRYDPESLVEVGEATPIGSIPYDKDTYQGMAPEILVRTSHDKSKILFYLDKIQSDKVQIILCWVTDIELQPIWSNIYQVPMFRDGARLSMAFTNEGSVILIVSGTFLTEANIKQTKKGVTKIVVTKEGNFRSVRAIKFHGEEFNMSDIEVPEGLRCNHFTLNIAGDKLYYAGFAYTASAKSADRWLLGTIEKDLTIDPPKVSHFAGGKSGEPTNIYRLLMDEDGHGYIVGGERGTATYVILAFNASFDLKWQSKLNVFPALRPMLHNGRLVVLSWNDKDMKDGTTTGKYGPVTKTWYNGRPFVVSFNETGTPYLEYLIPKGIKMNYNVEDEQGLFPTVAACGCATTIHSKKKEVSLYITPFK